MVTALLVLSRLAAASAGAATFHAPVPSGMEPGSAAAGVLYARGDDYWNQVFTEPYTIMLGIEGEFALDSNLRGGLSVVRDSFHEISAPSAVMGYAWFGTDVEFEACTLTIYGLVGGWTDTGNWVFGLWGFAIQVGAGAAVRVGNERVYLDISAPSPGLIGLGTGFLEDDIVLYLPPDSLHLTLGLSEAGVNLSSGPHTARLGLTTRLPTVTYRFECERFYAEASVMHLPREDPFSMMGFRLAAGVFI